MSNKTLMAKKHTAQILGLLNIPAFFTNRNMFGVLLWFVFPPETKQQSEKNGGQTSTPELKNPSFAMWRTTFTAHHFQFLLFFVNSRCEQMGLISESNCQRLCVCSSLGSHCFDHFLKKALTPHGRIFWQLQKGHCHVRQISLLIGGKMTKLKRWLTWTRCHYECLNEETWQSSQSITRRSMSGGRSKGLRQTVFLSEDHSELVHSFRAWRDYYWGSVFLFVEWSGSSYGDGRCLTPASGLSDVSWISLETTVLVDHWNTKFCCVFTGLKMSTVKLLACLHPVPSVPRPLLDVLKCHGHALRHQHLPRCCRCWWHPITAEWSPPTPLTASKSFAPFHRLSRVLRDILNPGANILEGICFKSPRQM